MTRGCHAAQPCKAHFAACVRDITPDWIRHVLLGVVSMSPVMRQYQGQWGASGALGRLTVLLMCGIIIVT